MNQGEKTFFRLSELLTEDERYNLTQLLVLAGKKHRLHLRRLPSDI